MKTLWKNLGRERCLLTDFISFFHSWRSSVFPCISDSHFSMRDSRCFTCSKFMWVQAEPRRSVYKPVGIRPVTKPEEMICMICIDMRCMAGTCYQNLSFKSWDAGDPRWIRRCSGGRAWRCARGTTCTLYCRWYHFGLMLMLFRPGGITWIAGRHRRALWRGMAFGCHHDIVTYTFNTHWHTMTWLTCPDGMKPLETLLPVAERALKFTVNIFKSSTCGLGGDVGRKSRRGDGVRSTGPGLIDFKILHTYLIGYFACYFETNSIRKFELHNRVWYG